MATDQDPSAYGAHFQSLRSRALISPRAARRMSVTNSGGSDTMTYPGYEGIAGQPEVVARRPRFTAGNELQLMRSEFGADYQQLAAAHDADQATERRTNRFQSQKYDYGATTSDNSRALRRDESGLRNHGAASYDHNNAKQFQAGGRMSKSASAGKETAPAGYDSINAARNSRMQPQESTVRDSNRNTTLRDGEHWLNRFATPRQVRRSSAVETHLGMENWYGGSSSRQESL